MTIKNSVKALRSSPQARLGHMTPLTGGKEIEFRVRNQTPESIVLPPECLDSSPLAHVPDPNRLVLSDGKNELMPGVKE